MKRLWSAGVLAGVFLLIPSCRTALPGAQITPLRSRTADEARQELEARAAAFAGSRSAMRVRIVTPERTQSFRAQLIVPDKSRMELVVYTPVGTTAGRLFADGERIQFENHVNPTEVRGTAEELARPFGFYAGGLVPAEMALLLLGLPPRPELQYVFTAAGLASATIGDVSVVFDPPSFPPKRVVITRGENRLEVEHQEIVSTK